MDLFSIIPVERNPTAINVGDAVVLTQNFIVARTALTCGC